MVVPFHQSPYPSDLCRAQTGAFTGNMMGTLMCCSWWGLQESDMTTSKQKTTDGSRPLPPYKPLKMALISHTPLLGQTDKEIDISIFIRNLYEIHILICLGRTGRCWVQPSACVCRQKPLWRAQSVAERALFALCFLETREEYQWVASWTQCLTVRTRPAPGVNLSPDPVCLCWKQSCFCLWVSGVKIRPYRNPWNVLCVPSSPGYSNWWT